MKIANPIYDSIFKYLLNDKKVAKLIISRIIGEEIVDLEMRPTEYQHKVIAQAFCFTVMRIDFSARIKKADGSEKIVIIEIQKARLPTDIMRFRRYLGEQYQSDNNMQINEKGQNEALPIVSIYFLGHKLDYMEAPVVRVQRKCFDAVTEEEIPHKEKFIEALSHDSFIIQIPFLKEKRRNKLEELLSIFDQSKATISGHYIDFDTDEYPKEYTSIVRRLEKAVQDKHYADKMDIEDDIVEQFSQYQRERQIAEEALEEERRQLELIRQEKEKERCQKEEERRLKEEACLEKEEERRQKEEERRLKEEALRQKESAEAKNRADREKMVQLLKSMGLSEQEIAEKLNAL